MTGSARFDPEKVGAGVGRRGNGGNLDGPPMKKARAKFRDVRPFVLMRSNVVLYEGPSVFTGNPIMVIATRHTSNRAIGPMIQFWIVPATSPRLAVKSGRDEDVCGDCKYRRHAGDDRGKGRGCFVEWWRAPENIWQAREQAEDMTPGFFAACYPGRQFRISGYGDPVAVPLPVWEPLIKVAGGWTAHTHAWHRPEAEPFRAWCMASVDTLDEQTAAAHLGWRTYRVRAYGGTVLPHEAICPKTEEGGYRATCATCSLCRGNARPAANIVCAAHGPNAGNAIRIITRASQPQEQPCQEPRR